MTQARSETSPSPATTAPPANPEEACTLELTFDSQEEILRLTGTHSALLKEVATRSGAQVSARGNSILISGAEPKVKICERFLRGASKLLKEGLDISVRDVAHSVRGLERDPKSSLEDLLEQVVLITPRRKPIAPKTAAQREYLAQIRKYDLTFGIGPAGTGKTYLAMAMAASALMQRKVKRIILTRPAVEAGEKLGFLPGDLSEKVNPYLRPLYDAMNDMLDYEKIQELRSRNQIEVAPLAFMRGRTLNDCFVILDEAQNATTDQMKMFLTRLGYGSKAVVTGDITQTDLPKSSRSGLATAQQILSNVDGIAFSHFTDVDVVRHPLVQRIVLAYDQHDQDIAEKRAAAKAAREAESQTAEVKLNKEPPGEEGETPEKTT
ncbi:MAG: PhoH family protein [Polyangiaceae bacterium]|nr:PhoH family protein [Polyangiaceae bacterium]